VFDMEADGITDFRGSYDEYLKSLGVTN
jgi:hypothetical protein